MDACFTNAAAIELQYGYVAIRGFALYELDETGGRAAFVAHKRWWNEVETGIWADFTPYSTPYQCTLLVESPLGMETPSNSRQPAPAVSTMPQTGGEAAEAQTAEAEAAEGEMAEAEAAEEAEAATAGAAEAATAEVAEAEAAEAEAAEAAETAAKAVKVERARAKRVAAKAA